MDYDKYRASFTAYMDVVATRSSIHYFEKIKNINSKEVQLEDNTIEEIFSDEVIELEFEFDYMKSEEFLSNTKYFNAFRRLTDKQKQIIALSSMTHIKDSDIAKLLHITESTVRTSRKKARDSFIKYLKGEI